jgi:hypothetical protein
VQGIVLEDGYVLPPPPSSEIAGIWRDKDKLIISRGTQLPDRCVKCNAPAPGARLKKKYSWHEPIFYILIFAGLLVYFVVAMFVRKSITLELGLCEEHKAKRRRNVLVTWSFFLLVLVSFFLAAIVDEVFPAIIGILLACAGTVYAVVTLRMVAPTRIDKNFAWMTGFNGEYLARFPQWRG